MSGVVRGRPDRMDAYAEVADQVGADLARHRDDLAGALEAFRASAGWQGFLDRVPPLELDVDEVRVDQVALGRWVGGIGAQLARLDAGEDGVVTVDLSHLSWFQRLLLSTPPPVGGEHRFLVLDGEVHYRGSDAAEFVELVAIDGQLVLRVSVRTPGGGLEVVGLHPLPDDVTSLTIRTGAGNDVVSVPPGVADRIDLAFDLDAGNNLLGYVNPDASIVSVTGGDGIRVFAGDGDNTVYGSGGDDRISLGGGDNHVAANAGHDHVVTAGSGSNRVLGGDGDDHLATGSGDDLLDGGNGADRLRTVDGRNVLAAGRGDGDVLVGGSGDDVFVAGRGSTAVVSGGGADRVYADGTDRHTIDGTGAQRLEVVRIEVPGEPGADAIRLQRPAGVSDAEWEAWIAGVDSDLELLRHTPSGNAGLDALDQDVGRGGWPWNRQPRIVVEPVVHTVDGVPTSFDVEGFMDRGVDHNSSVASSRPLRTRYDGAPLLGQDRTSGSPTPGAVILYHELAHDYDYATGNSDRSPYDEVVLDADGDEVSRREVRSANEINSVGYDQDGDGRVTDDETRGDHPAALTEHRVRQDLGLPTRPGYVTDPDDVPAGGRVVWEEQP